MTQTRFASWRLCPACRSYRFTWLPLKKWGKCQDCGEVQHG